MCNAFTDLTADSPEIEELKEKIERLEKANKIMSDFIRALDTGDGFYSMRGTEVLSAVQKTLKEKVRRYDNKGAPID